MQAREKILRSVDSLETIYAVVVAFAVTKAIEGVLLSGNTADIDLSLLLTHLPELIAFVVTIVPFYHGMHRHLNRVYVERGVSKTHQGYLLLDFFVFFVESCLLLVFAASLSLGVDSFKPLIILLILDSLWAIIAHGIHYDEWKNSPWKWAAINTVSIAVMALFIFSTIFDSEFKKIMALMSVAIIRTALDYIFCWPFYFPNEDS